MSRLHRKSLQGIPQPAALRDVDDDAVGTAQLDLSMAGALASARLAAPSPSLRLAIAAGGRSIACDSEDIQSRRRAVVPVCAWL